MHWRRWERLTPPSAPFSKWVKKYLALFLIYFTRQALHWCEEGIFLLANQPVDRCQSQDGAEAALQELERYLDTAPLHTLADRSTFCCQYEATLTAQLLVRKMWIHQL